LDSIQKLKPSAPGKGKAATAPHFLTPRYADFCAAIVKLNRDYGDDILINTMRRLRTEVEKLLMRTASRLPVPKLQMIFLINNYNAIKATIEARVGACDEVNHFDDLSSKCTPALCRRVSRRSVCQP
jgi:hypothetical protein